MTEARKKSTDTNKKSNPRREGSKGDKAAASQVSDDSRALRTEIAAILWITFGLLLALGIYFIESSLFGQAVSSFIFGTLGILGFVIPIVFVAIGVLTIIKSTTTAMDKTWVYVLLMFVALATLINVNMRPVSGTTMVPGEQLTEYSPSYWQYLSDCYTQSAKPAYGGLLGGILSYPLLKLLSVVGSNILLAGLMLVDLILVTRISIREVGATIADKSRKSREARRERIESQRRRARIDDENDYFAENEPALATVPRKTRRATTSSAQEDDLFFAEDNKRKRKSFSWLDEPFGGKKNVNAPTETDMDEQPLASDAAIPFDADDYFSEPLRTHDTQAVDSPDFSVRTAELDDDDTDDAAINNGFENDITAKAATVRTATGTAASTTAASMSTVASASPLSSASASSVEDDIIHGQNANPTGGMRYQRPPVTLLTFPPATIEGRRREVPDAKARALVESLASFKISVQVTNVSVGPTVTRFEIQPAKGIRIRSITALADDIALALAAPKVRIEAPIPGKSAIGVEIPNDSVTCVYLRDVIDTPEFRDARSPLTIALGKDIVGKNVITDLAKMPHLLIAGTTGSGKSVCMNTIILSFLFKSSPDDLRIILIDPKHVEFKPYADIPHLLIPVVSDCEKAASALRWAVSEMERRNILLADSNVKDIASYNTACVSPDSKLARIVVIIDELTDLMMTAPREVETSVARLAQLGRACGIHLILATQRPSADVITGIIKSNIASRIAFLVSDATNSRVILDCNGAEKLIGNGDMLFHPNGTPKPQRVQGSFVTNDEVAAVTEFYKRTSEKPTFDDVADTQITAGITVSSSKQSNGKKDDAAKKSSYDPMFVQAVRVAICLGRASGSLLQRNLRIGYNRASILIEQMEKKKFVSGFDGSRSRKVFITAEEFEEIFGEPCGTRADIIPEDYPESSDDTDDAGDDISYDE